MSTIQYFRSLLANYCFILLHIYPHQGSDLAVGDDFCQTLWEWKAEKVYSRLVFVQLWPQLTHYQLGSARALAHRLLCQFTPFYQDNLTVNNFKKKLSIIEVNIIIVYRSGPMSLPTAIPVSTPYCMLSFPLHSGQDLWSCCPAWGRGAPWRRPWCLPGWTPPGCKRKEEITNRMSDVE